MSKDANIIAVVAAPHGWERIWKNGHRSPIVCWALMHEYVDAQDNYERWVAPVTADEIHDSFGEDVVRVGRQISEP